MSEEHNDGTWSGLVKTAVGTAGTLVMAGGTWAASHLFGGEEAEVAQPAAVAAPAPVINITTNQTQQQAAGGGKTVIIKEKAAAPAKPKAKTAQEELEEAPKW